MSNSRFYRRGFGFKRKSSSRPAGSQGSGKSDIVGAEGYAAVGGSGGFGWTGG